MELEIAYLETYKRGNYVVAMADACNAVKLIANGWSQITKEQYDNPHESTYTRIDLTLRGQKARII